MRKKYVQVIILKKTLINQLIYQKEKWFNHKSIKMMMISICSCNSKYCKKLKLKRKANQNMNFMQSYNKILTTISISNRLISKLLTNLTKSWSLNKKFKVTTTRRHLSFQIRSSSMMMMMIQMGILLSCSYRLKKIQKKSSLNL